MDRHNTRAIDQDFRHILDQLDASLPPAPPSLSSSTSSATSPRSVRTVRLQPRPSPPATSMRKLFGGSSNRYNTFDSSQLSSATRDVVRIATVDSVDEAYGADKSDTASLRSSSKHTETFTATVDSPSVIKPQPKRSLSLSLPSPPRLRKSRSVQAKLSAVSDADLATACDQKDAKIKALEDELRLVKCQRRQERAMAHVEIEQLRKERSIAEKQVEKFHFDLEDKVAMEEYASLIQDMSPMTAVGPSHLSKLQTQLCKSLHNQGVLEGQIDFLKRECHTTVETIKDELASVLQERDVMEQELVKKLQQAEESKRLQAKLFDERMALRVENISDFAEYFRMSAPLPSLPSITTRTSDSIPEGRDSAPCDVDTGSFVTADSKVVGIAHRLEQEKLQRERTEDNLRRKLDEKSTAIADLQARVKSQQTHIGTLTKELDQKRRQDIRREMMRTHRRHASHSIVVTSASTITRATNAPSSFSGIAGSGRSGYSTPDTAASSSKSLRSSNSSSSNRPPLHKRGSSDPSRGGHLIGSSPTW